MQAHETQWADALRAERRGDRVSYERFLAELAHVLRGIVRYRLGTAGLSADEIEDVVQDVLIAVHTRRRQWDAARPLMPWLNAIVRYKAIDAVRRIQIQRRRHVALDDAAWQAVVERQDVDVVDTDLDLMLAHLPPGQQSVLRALAIDGASAGEAAQRLGMSLGAVRVAFHRGLKRLMQVAGTWNR